jgi:hypothetical protein
MPSIPPRGTTLGTLETHIAYHCLYVTDGRDRIVTYVAGEEIADKALTPREAGEWLETVRRCGGVVHGRGVLR